MRSLFRSSRCTARHTRALVFVSVVAAVSAVACGGGDSESQLGALKLGLTTQAGGAVYRLGNAKFSLEGPEKREFSGDGQDAVELELAAGAYRLTLLDGFQLALRDAPDSAPVAATLISQNPAPVLISPGTTTTATLRFALDGGNQVALGNGRLHVGIEVAAADAGAQTASGCAGGLRIDELDYEQLSSDDAEFIELLNIGPCAADLTGVTLELVNGGDDKVYTRYALHDAAPTLEPGQRIVIGDAKVLAALPASLPQLALNGSGLQNGPDGLRIVRDGQTLDAVAYEDKVPACGEGAAAPADDGAQSLARCPDGFDTDDNALDFKLSTPTPGTASVCP